MSGFSPVQDLPDGYKGGQFHLVGDGIANRITFSEPFVARGIDGHLGTPALAPKSMGPANILQHLVRTLTITNASGAIAPGKVFML